MWSTIAEPTAVFDAHVLARLGERTGLQTWPVVLDMWFDDPDAETVAARTGHADRVIAEHQLIVDGEPAGWLAPALRVLAAPERQIEIRTFATGSALAARRVCLARNGNDNVVAIREGTRIDVRMADVATEERVGAIVAREVEPMASPGSPAPSIEFAGLATPAAEFAERLGRCTSAAETADVLRALGASVPDAVTIAAALDNCVARSEIVAVSWSAGTSTQSSGALAVFDTDRGRIMASPSKSPDGRVWTTLSPGTGHRIMQAVGLLIETLPEGRWLP